MVNSVSRQVSKEEELSALDKKRRKRDLKELIEVILETPLKKKGDVMFADGEVSLEQLSKENTDVQTRIVMAIARNAAGGDVKSAEFLMRFSGKEPPRQQHLTMELPTIIDDMTDRVTPVIASCYGTVGLKKGGEDDDEDED